MDSEDVSLPYVAKIRELLKQVRNNASLGDRFKPSQTELVAFKRDAIYVRNLDVDTRCNSLFDYKVILKATLCFTAMCN